MTRYLPLEALTTGSDGTTYRNRTYDSLHINLHAPASYENPDVIKPTTRFVGVRMLPNHRTETQIEADLASFQHLSESFNLSPLRFIISATKAPFSIRTIFTKMVGTHSDHAHDVKAKHKRLLPKKDDMCDLARVEEELYNMPYEQSKDIFEKIEDSLWQNAGGQEAWEALDPLVRQRQTEKVMEDALRELVDKKEFEGKESDLRTVSIWVWAGCMMHKDMNALKGACARMRATWTELDESPRRLANRDNAAILAAVNQGLVDADAAGRATAYTVGGGDKVTALWGAFLNHKDKKKGQHDAFRDFAKDKLGLTMTFPDTSNTRFGSHLDAAAELLERLDFYLEFINHVRDLRDNFRLTHLEQNAKDGLEDGPTRTELAVMTLYREVVSIPYLSAVRGPGLEGNNALNMGALHKKVVDHISKLIENPDLVLSSNAVPHQAILDASEEWDRPGAVYAVHSLAPELRHLRIIFVAFLEGALETWQRFSEEFEEDGEIAKLTDEEKELCWMPATNDANESALATYCSFARRFPTGGLQLSNSLQKYQRNNTGDFMKHVLTTPEDHAFMRKEARARLDAKPDQKTRLAVTKTNIEEAKAKRQRRRIKQTKKNEREHYLADLELILDNAELEKLKRNEIKDQIAKHKILEYDLPTKTIPTKLPTKKADLLSVLKRAVEEYMRARELDEWEEEF